MMDKSKHVCMTKNCDVVGQFTMAWKYADSGFDLSSNEIN